jgi:Cu2+-exporting ATPase
LGLSVPAVQVVATGRLFQQGLFVKSGDALERLAEIDIAVFDKTGTLTDSQPVLENKDVIGAGTLEQAARLARASHHPLARALAAAAGAGPVAAGIVEQAGAGMEALEEGHRLRLGSAAWCDVPAPNPAMRLWFARDGAAPIGFAFREALKPEAPAMLANLARDGIEIEMLTGDHRARAMPIARELGIRRFLADIGPRAKADHIQWLKDVGRKVLMVGDGINDAAAMALAHVSIAPGSASDVSQLAADMVLRGGDLAPIGDALRIARAARRLALQNFALALAYNLTAIPMAAMGFVTPVIASATMAGSSLLVTLNALRLAR